jgi:hypothetical protein
VELILIYASVVLVVLVLSLLSHAIMAFEYSGIDLNHWGDLVLVVARSVIVPIGLYAISLNLYHWYRYPYKRAQ